MCIYGEYSKTENLEKKIKKKFKRKKRMCIYSEYSKIENLEENQKKKISNKSGCAYIASIQKSKI